MDDPSWSDKDGDTCADYAQVISDGKWTQSRACEYNSGAAKNFCRKTCKTCNPSANTCADTTCIITFKQVTGRCEQCADWSRFCTGKTASWFKNECPLTCGVCSPSSRARERAPLSSVSGEKAPPAKGTQSRCNDDKCIAAWKTGDKCPTCSELGNKFCSEEVFASACRRTCNLCTDDVVDDACKDVFSTFTCSRYKAYGWCTRSDMREPVSRQCPLTCGVCTPGSGNSTLSDDDRPTHQDSKDGAEDGKESGAKDKQVYGWPPPRGRSSSYSISAPKHQLAATVMVVLGLGHLVW